MIERFVQFCVIGTFLVFTLLLMILLFSMITSSVFSRQKKTPKNIETGISKKVDLSAPLAWRCPFCSAPNLVIPEHEDIDFEHAERIARDVYDTEDWAEPDEDQIEFIQSKAKIVKVPAKMYCGNCGSDVRTS